MTKKSKTAPKKTKRVEKYESAVHDLLDMQKIKEAKLNEYKAKVDKMFAKRMNHRAERVNKIAGKMSARDLAYLDSLKSPMK
jgi:hypothetical protein